MRGLCSALSLWFNWYLSIAIILRSDKFMNAVGIDVSKGKSMVAIMRPFGEIVSTPFEIKHTTSDINSLPVLAAYLRLPFSF